MVTPDGLVMCLEGCLMCKRAAQQHTLRAVSSGIPAADEHQHQKAACMQACHALTAQRDGHLIVDRRLHACQKSAPRQALPDPKSFPVSFTIAPASSSSSNHAACYPASAVAVSPVFDGLKFFRPSQVCFGACIAQAFGLQQAVGPLC